MVLLFTEAVKGTTYKLTDIKERMFTVLYYEALCVYNDEPYLLRSLTDYGIKNNCFSMDLILQYTYLVSRPTLTP